jgi:peptide/nickel transport system permease protein
MRARDRAVDTSECRVYLKRLSGNSLCVVGVASLLLVVVVALLAPVLTAYDPIKVDPRSMLVGPSLTHLFGTDHFGRDLYTRVLFGTRISLRIGTIVTLLTGVLGAAIGLASGYFRRLDGPIMRLMDVLMAFPAILLAIGVMAVLGTGEINAIIALIIVYTPRCARIVRASTLTVKAREYVQAARVLGAREGRIIVRHIFPNCLSPLIVQLVFVFAYAIVAEAALSFIGVGTPPPTPSLGNILSEGRNYLAVAPWTTIAPGIAISVTVLALNLAGDGLRDILDPKMKLG